MQSNNEKKSECRDAFLERWFPGDVKFQHIFVCSKCKTRCQPQNEAKAEMPKSGTCDCHCGEPWYEKSFCEKGVCGFSHCEYCYPAKLTPPMTTHKQSEKEFNCTCRDRSQDICPGCKINRRNTSSPSRESTEDWEREFEMLSIQLLLVGYDLKIITELENRLKTFYKKHINATRIAERNRCAKAVILLKDDRESLEWNSALYCAERNILNPETN